MNFNIESTPIMPKAGLAASATLYASVNGRASSLANGEVIFYDAASERVHVMTEQVLAAMDVCRPFRTLDAHVAALRQAIPSLPQGGDTIRRVLESLHARGLLVSDVEFVRHLGGGAAIEKAEFAGFFIRACDRPEQLKRLLGSLAQYEAKHRPGHRYSVIDDSRDAGNARRHRALLDEFSANTGCRTFHVGADAWQRVLRVLADDARAPGLLDWLLQRELAKRVHGGGLAMNLIALLSAGKRYALLDDDFVFPLRLHPDADGRIDLAGNSQMPARFFPSLDAAVDAGNELESDPLQDHLDACGASLGELINRHPRVAIQAHDLAGLTPSTLPHLQHGRRVVATVNGHRGHSGSASTAWFFLLDKASRASLCADRDSYLRHLDSPCIWYGPVRTRTQASGNFTPFMVDGSALLPYTSPAGRNEDLLFGSLCRFMHPASITLHLPTSIGHVQERERSRKASLSEAFTPNSNAYLADMALSSISEFCAVEPAQRLRGLATRVRDMSWASSTDILGAVREHLAATRANLIQQFQHMMQTAKEAPIYWQADLRQLIEINGKALTQSAPPRLGDWDPLLSSEATVANYRESMARHADTMEYWPELWESAKSRSAKLWKAIA